MLLEFEDDGLRRLYTEPDFRLPWMGPDLTRQYRMKMAVLANASDERDLRAMRSLHLEKLVADRKDQHSIRFEPAVPLDLQAHTG